MSFIDEPANISVAPSVAAQGSLQLSSATSLALALALGGDIYEPATVVQSRALNSTRIRIDFSSILDNNAGLLLRSNFQIQASGPGPVAVNVLQVVVPSFAPLFVELVVSEMTDGASYTVTVNPGSPAAPVTSGGVVVSNLPSPFTGDGIAPVVALVIATSGTQAEVRFSENVKSTGDVSLPTTYTFDNGLNVLSVVSVSGRVVVLETSEQDPDILYTLTTNGVIQDGANNPLVVPVGSPMLGFQPLEDLDPARTQEIYNFIIQTIRDEDQQNGEQILERYLEGPQAVWQTITDIILSIPALWDVTKIPDEFLVYLKNIVGWTKELNAITDVLDAPTLRRLIANSVAFWKRRGTESSTEDILNLVTSARVRILNWFYYRFIVGEDVMSSEVDGLDLSIIPYLGGEDSLNGDETLYEVRIVDDGGLNRALVKELVKLTRPMGERVLIIYLAAMDLFSVSSDNSQWDSNMVVDEGVGIVTSDGGVVASILSLERALVWTNYTALFRFKQRAINLASESSVNYLIYRSGEGDAYGVRITIQEDGSGATYRIYKETASVFTTLATGPVPFEMYNDVFYGLQLVASPSGAETVLNLYIDGNPIATASDSDQVQGTISIEARADSEVELDIIEVFLNPLEQTLIGIGGAVTDYNF